MIFKITEIRLRRTVLSINYGMPAWRMLRGSINYFASTVIHSPYINTCEYYYRSETEPEERGHRRWKAGSVSCGNGQVYAGLHPQLAV